MGDGRWGEVGHRDLTEKLRGKGVAVYKAEACLRGVFVWVFVNGSFSQVCYVCTESGGQCSGADSACSRWLSATNKAQRGPFSCCAALFSTVLNSLRCQ